MMSRMNGSSWMEGKEEQAPTPNDTTANNNNNHGGLMQSKEDIGGLSTFKSMLEVEDDWYMTNNNTIPPHHNQDGIKDISFPTNFGEPENLLLHSVDSSSSCSPTATVFNSLDPSQVNYFTQQPKPTLSSFFNVVSNNNPLEHGFDLAEIGFLDNQGTSSAATTNAVTTNVSTLLNRGGGILGNFTDLNSNGQINAPALCSGPSLPSNRIIQLPEIGGGFTGFKGFNENSGNVMFMNRSKMLRPLETFPSMGAQPTLFQKRAALRKHLGENEANLETLNGIGREKGKLPMFQMSEENDKKRKFSNRDDFMDDLSIDGSGLNYDSDDLTESMNIKVEEENGKNGGTSSNANSRVAGNGGDQKGKKKGLPAKNLMAERRRRKKLNDRLYLLRSVVPRISKMDRASILGDAIEYLKELLQKINDLHNELETTPPGSSLTPSATSFHPLTPTASALPSHIKDKLYPSPLPSPNGQPARVEVRVREGRAVNIHMFSSRRPGILLSTMKALDTLGLDVQQAVISCFNGFAMDIFRAEQCREGQDTHPEQIKAVLLESAGFHGMM